MSAKIQPPQLPKGTRDFYPEAERVQQYIFDTWRKVAEMFAYEAYEGPMFEHLDLFTGKSGDEIVSQLYNFTDKGGREIALRPEMTPTLARLVIQKGRELRKPFKWYSMPRLFRYEKAQKGRLREFFQLNMDIIGTDSIYAEADLLAAIATMLRLLGLKDENFVIGVSSRKLLATYLEEIGVENPALVYPVLDKRLKIGPEAFAKALADANVSSEQVAKLDALMSCKTLDEVDALVAEDAAKNALNEMKELFNTLNAAGYADCVALDLSVVRGLAYYTGIVFEVFDRGKSMRAIAGGGRYDSLTEKLGGDRMPGVGFGMGDVVLADLLREYNLLPEMKQSVDFYIASFTNDMQKIFTVAEQFRKFATGEKYFAVSHPLSSMKMGKQMGEANGQGAKIVIYVDGDKASEGSFEFKDLRDGSMHIGSFEEIVNAL